MVIGKSGLQNPGKVQNLFFEHTIQKGCGYQQISYQVGKYDGFSTTNFSKPLQLDSKLNKTGIYLSMKCHPSCVCENWKWFLVKHNYVN